MSESNVQNEYDNRSMLEAKDILRLHIKHVHCGATLLSYFQNAAVVEFCFKDLSQESSTSVSNFNYLAKLNNTFQLIPDCRDVKDPSLKNNIHIIRQ